MKKKVFILAVSILLLCTSTLGCSKTNKALDKGISLLRAGFYYEAIEPLETAVTLDNTLENNANLLATYYKSDRLLKCQSLALRMIDEFEDNFWSKYYLSHTYRDLGEYEKSISLLEELLESYPRENTSGHAKHDNFILDIASISYYYLKDSDKALEYLDKYENQGTDSDSVAQDLRNKIRSTPNHPEDVRYIEQLFRDNYLYESNFNAFDGLTGDLSDDEISKLFDSVKQKDDLFSFIIQGERYDSYKKRGSGLEYKNLGKNIHYINIETFSKTLYYEFLYAIDNITDHDNATLIIDVRDNSGGLILPTIKILDHLTGSAPLFKKVFSDKSEEKFSSDDSHMDFEKIYVLVNNESASTSEILALSLDTNLDNVVVVGEQTFGKGVGQSIIKDVKKKRIYYIVNFYWNVGDTNIHGVGMTPEVLLKNDEIDEYMMNLLDLEEF